MLLFFSPAGFDTDVNATVNKSTCWTCSPTIVTQVEGKKKKKKTKKKQSSGSHSNPTHVCNCPCTGLCFLFPWILLFRLQTYPSPVSLCHASAAEPCTGCNQLSVFSLLWSKVVVNSINNYALFSPFMVSLRRCYHQSVACKKAKIEAEKKRISISLLPDLVTVVMMMFVRGGAECSFSPPRNVGYKGTLVHVCAWLGARASHSEEAWINARNPRIWFWSTAENDSETPGALLYLSQ